MAARRIAVLSFHTGLPFFQSSMVLVKLRRHFVNDSLRSSINISVLYLLSRSEEEPMEEEEPL